MIQRLQHLTTADKSLSVSDQSLHRSERLNPHGMRVQLLLRSIGERYRLLQLLGALDGADAARVPQVPLLGPGIAQQSMRATSEHRLHAMAPPLVA
jgi:hypothetical protein